MPHKLPDPLNVVILRNEPPETAERIKAIAPERLHVSQFNHRGDPPPGLGDALREGHVAFVSSRCPRDLGSRMPNLLWLHAGFAGITDLSDRDFWGTNITMTSARGVTGALPIGEMALAAAMMLAKRLHYAARTAPTVQTEDAYESAWLITNKTVGIIGLGGIGSALAKLAKGIGMRVLGTRRSATAREKDADGVDELYPPGELLEMAKQSHFLAVCSPHTPETFQMVNASVMDALPGGAIIMNVARGEIIDEEAMVQRLESGKLGGAYLDVYTGEGKRDPDPKLANHPNVVMTPHISDFSDTKQHFSVDVFCENLERFLKGEPLINVVDWERGY